MEITQILEKNIYIFFFVFYRTILLFFLFPVFGAAFLPIRLKILISLVLAIVLTPVLSFKLPAFTDIIKVLLSDFIFIFLISLIFRIFLAGIQLGGELVGIQMGFGISQTMDPLSGFSMPVISQFVYIIFLLLFFNFNFHHYLIYFLYESFKQIPPGSFLLKEDLAVFIIKKSKLIFELSIKFLAPLLVFMMLIYVSLGVIGRLIPQMNVIFVAFPLITGLGIMFFGFMLVLLPRMIHSCFSDYFKSIFIFLR
ncbi:MAG: Flagellar biosynthesis protein FliR [Thermodesulfobacterium sp.]|uniref:Flagellar biosynthesis protein FliR n=1 Tax=Candidatus Thermodesulfobacterium syntrophicum TaxID=3060442 RepID=A0AAE3TEH8_9BACT|nr:Flagellar biosynthesis protein FliR [Candidatus Thermodesulfobacterium syntrophicum]